MSDTDEFSYKWQVGSKFKVQRSKVNAGRTFSPKNIAQGFVDRPIAGWNATALRWDAFGVEMQRSCVEMSYGRWRVAEQRWDWPADSWDACGVQGSKLEVQWRSEFKVKGVGFRIRDNWATSDELQVSSSKGKGWKVSVQKWRVAPPIKKTSYR